MEKLTDSHELLNLVKNVPVIIRVDEKDKIIRNIKNSIKTENYLILKLLLYGPVTNENLLNFLLYITLSSERLYRLFVNEPRKFGNAFMFPVLPDELPKIFNLLNQEELEVLIDDIKCDELVLKFKSADLVLLKKLFGNMIYFAKINPFASLTE